MYRSITILLFILLPMITGCDSTGTQETTGSDVPEAKKVTIEEVEEGIRTHVAEMTREGNGYFYFENDSLDLKLKLVRVHTEYLSVLGKHEFFACVDLATENGDVYDFDFFLEGVPGDMHVIRTDMHKLNGRPYYTWKQAEDKTWFTVPVSQSSNELLGVVEGEDAFHFTYSVRLPEITGSASMWIPVAQSDTYQKIEVLAMEAPGEQRLIRDSTYGNQILHLTLLPEHSGKEIRIEYQVLRMEKNAYASYEDLSVYLAPAPLLPVGDRFRTIATEVIGQKQAATDIARARALYDHVIDEMRYAKQGIYGTGDAEYACDSKSGNCTEFHSYFISLARSAGIPARFAVGAAIPSERDEGGVDGYHCWAEFYADGKWWPVDISEANKYTALATYYFGHHPANRIEFSRGRNIIPDPEPATGPINFLAYPVLEVEGEPDYPETRFTFVRSRTGS